jgi:hypothetical protein
MTPSDIAKAIRELYPCAIRVEFYVTYGTHEVSVKYMDTPDMGTCWTKLNGEKVRGETWH